ncbi:MAG: DUF1361 domain-containing protein, partial [Bacteroidetes bacterium]
KFIALILVLGFSFILVQFRVEETGHRIFRFFWWNLLLAVISWISSELLRKTRSGWYLLGLGALTVLFLPNAPYMITDLFHLRSRAEFPLWYDTLLVFWFAVVGVALFYLSLFNLRNAFMRFGHWFWTEISIACICFLNGFGIYLGRYLRFNSWDVLSNSDELAEQILDRLINASDHTRMVGVTLLYGFSLLLGYWIIRLYRAGQTTI